MLMRLSRLLSASSFLFLIMLMSGCVSLPLIGSDSEDSKGTQDKVVKVKAKPAQASSLFDFSTLASSSTSELKNSVVTLLEGVIEPTRYFQAGVKGDVIALNLESGQQIWKTKLRSTITAGLGDDVYNLYAVDENAILYAISKNTGQVAWKTQLQSGVQAAPSSNNLVVAVHAVDSKVYGLDPLTGKLFWVHTEQKPEIAVRGNSRPQFVDSQWVVVGLDNGKIIGLRAQQGGLAWEKRVNVPSLSESGSTVSDVDFPIYDLGPSLLMNARPAKVIAVDKASGKLIWEGEYDEAIKHINVGAGYIAVTLNSDYLFVHDSRNGKLMWAMDELSGYDLSQSWVDGYYLYVTDKFSTLHQINMATGVTEARWRLKMNPASSSIKLLRNGLLVAADDSGKIKVFQLTPKSADIAPAISPLEAVPNSPQDTMKAEAVNDVVEGFQQSDTISVNAAQEVVDAIEDAADVIEQDVISNAESETGVIRSADDLAQ